MDKETRIQPHLTVGCKARLAFYCTLKNKTQGEIVERALNEFFDRQDIPCVPSDTQTEG